MPVNIPIQQLKQVLKWVVQRPQNGFDPQPWRGPSSDRLLAYVLPDLVQRIFFCLAVRTSPAKAESLGAKFREGSGKRTWPPTKPYFVHISCLQVQAPELTNPNRQRYARASTFPLRGILQFLRPAILTESPRPAPRGPPWDRRSRCPPKG